MPREILARLMWKCLGTLTIDFLKGIKILYYFNRAIWK